MSGSDAVSLGFTPGDVVIVTGAGSGIGRATAVSAAAQGLTVAAWDIDERSAAATSTLIGEAGGESVPVVADVNDRERVAAALQRSARLGPVRFLVNNAGPPSSAQLDFDDALTRCVGSMRSVATQWLDGDELSGRALVNVASVAGNIVGTAPDWYSASKAAIAGYTRHLATYRSHETRANALAPGMVDTPRLAGFTSSETGQRVLGRMPLRRLARPDEISWPILFLLSPLASYINGALLVADGGWTVSQ